jgi:cytochrome d ubiquinol oxidase subunit II
VRIDAVYTFGQPDVVNRRLENPVVVPGLLSFLVYGSFGSTVTGLDAFPRDQWPDNIELLYYAYHVMAGLGTLFIALLGLAAYQLWRGRLERSTVALGADAGDALPVHRHHRGVDDRGAGPAAVVDLRAHAHRRRHLPRVSAGNTLFTLIGFAGLYLVMGILFLYLVGREIAHGRAGHTAPSRRRSTRRWRGGCLMEALWFAIVAVMLAVYVVLDGFDFGAGFLHLHVARTDSERRTVLAAIGPVWDGNEVWLIAGGGALFMAFPVAYAVGFSGFYMPLMLLLWVLILRGLSIEFRSHVTNPLWAAFWDATFALGSTLIAIVLGAALGNVLRGVPLDATRTFHVPLFDSFWPGKDSGVLDAYTVLVGVFTLLALGGHGGLYLAQKTDGAVHARSLRAARFLWSGAGALFPLVTWGTVRVAPELPAVAAGRPLVWVLAALWRRPSPRSSRSRPPPSRARLPRLRRHALHPARDGRGRTLAGAAALERRTLALSTPSRPPPPTTGCASRSPGRWSGSRWRAATSSSGPDVPRQGPGDPDSRAGRSVARARRALTREASRGWMRYAHQAVSRTLPLLLLLLASPARAQPAIPVEVQVGKTTKVDVGLAQGLNCDDLGVVDAKLVPSKDKKNVFLVLKGRAPGDTYCRAGTGLGATVLVHVTVTEPPL